LVISREADEGRQDGQYEQLVPSETRLAEQGFRRLDRSENVISPQLKNTQHFL
jgi:hypothetical protein